MDSNGTPQWLKWAREMAAIGQTGLHFSTNEFDRIRYNRLVELSSEILAEYTRLPKETYQQVILRQNGYATPKVDVRGAVFQDERILLVREIADGNWSLPGGWADVNEAPAAMVEREVWEESGLRVKARKLVGVYEANHDRDPVEVFHAYKLVFLCDPLSGELHTSNETSAVDFFPLDHLPPFSLARTRLAYIEEAHAHLLDPNKPAWFD